MLFLGVKLQFYSVRTKDWAEKYLVLSENSSVLTEDNVLSEAMKRVKKGIEACFAGRLNRVRDVSAAAERFCSGR